MMRWFQLSVAIEQRSIPPDRQHRAIEGGFGLRIKLVDANHEIGLRALRGLAQRRNFRSIKAYAILEELACRLPPGVRERAIDEKGIAGQPGLAEGDDIGFVLGRFGDPFERDLKARLFIE